MFTGDKVIRLCQKTRKWVLVSSMAFFLWVVAFVVPGGLSVPQAVVLIASALTRPLDSHQHNELAFSSCAQPCIRAVICGWSRVSLLCLCFCTSLVVNVEMW